MTARATAPAPVSTDARPDGAPPAGRTVPAGPDGVGARRTLAVAVLCVGVALAPTLGALAQQWRYQTPVSEVIAVPVLTAALLAVVLGRHRYLGRLPRSHRVDAAVLGLLGAATAGLLVAGPRLWPTGYWTARLDLLAFPLVLAAVLTALLGVRSLLALKAAVAFAALAWPLPWAALLEVVSPAVTAVTSGCLSALVRGTGLATVERGNDALTLRVPATADGFLVSVASACSGTGSLVAITLATVAGSLLLTGRTRAKIAWAATGLALAWAGNLARLVLLVWAGGTWGEHVALSVLHPVAGLVVLQVAFAVLLLLLPRFGLTWRQGPVAPVDSPLLRPASGPERAGGPGRRRLLAAGAVALAVLGADVTVTGVARPGPSSVQARLSLAEVLGPGSPWAATFVSAQPWAEPYFGAGSRWDRWRVQDVAGRSGPVARTSPDGAPDGLFTAWVDTIETGSLAALTARPVVDCYHLHGFTLTLDRPVTVAPGVTGRQVGYVRPDGEQWSAVTWDWTDASAVPAGGRPRFERMTLLSSFSAASVTSRLRAAAPGTALDPDLDSAASRRIVVETLTATARRIAAARLGVPTTRALAAPGPVEVAP